MASINDEEPSIDSNKLSYEIFSILESKFLFGYDDHKLSSPPNDVVLNNNLKNQRGKVCVLSIDDGGMRALLAGKTLSYLELALKTKSGNPNATISDYFDVAAGSGIGGIFTSMLFATSDGQRPISTADDTWKLLAENGKSIYGKASGYVNRFLKRSGRFEKMMKERFNKLTLKDTLKPVLIPCYDLKSSAPFLFSRADALETDSYDFRLSEVCRATSADTGRFRMKPVLMKSIDGKTECVAVGGGLGMSNPTAAAITHVLHNKQEFPFVRGVEDILVLSLGSMGMGVEMGCEVDKVKKWKDLGRISSDCSADVVDQAVGMAFGQCGSSNYVRIQANVSNLGKCVANMDTDTSLSNVKKLSEMAEEMLKQKNVESVMFEGKKIGEKSNYEMLDWFAGELVVEHQKRSCRIAPTVAFKQVYPNPS